MNYEERVTIFLQYGEGAAGKESVFVSVNGNDFCIPRNVFIDVPFVVYAVLRDSRQRFSLDLHKASINIRLDDLLARFNAAMDRIHDEAIDNFDTLARRVGQRMRVDRATK